LTSAAVQGWCQNAGTIMIAAPSSISFATPSRFLYVFQRQFPRFDQVDITGWLRPPK